MNKNLFGNSTVESVSKIEKTIENSKDAKDCLERLKCLSLDFSADGVMDFAIKTAKELKGFDIKEEIDAIREDIKESDDEYSEFGKKLWEAFDCLDNTSEAEALGDKLKFCIDGFLYEGQIALLAGGGGCGKTSLILRIIKDLSLGVHPFLTNHNKKKQAILHNPKKCLFLTAEDTRAILGRRYKRLKEIKVTGLGKAGEKSYVASLVGIRPHKILEPDNKKVSETEFFQELKKIVKKQKPNLLVLDPLSNISGLTDENSNSLFSYLIDALNELIASCDEKLSIILLHHLSKTKEREGASKIRGASAFVDNVRMACVMNREKNNNYSTLSIEKANELTQDEKDRIASLRFFITSDCMYFESGHNNTKESQGEKKGTGKKQSIEDFIGEALTAI